MKISEETITRFWEKVDKQGPNECWPWVGSKDCKGYGQIRIDYKIYSAHRISWIIHYGEIPPSEFPNDYHGTCICHRCDNPSCVNPKHLLPGSNLDNMIDAAEKGMLGSLHRTLTKDQADKIRCLYSTGDVSQRQLGKMFEVCHTTIQRIVENRTYVH